MQSSGARLGKRGASTARPALTIMRANDDRAAITVADLLRSLNRSPEPGAPVGQEALDRLEAAVNEIRGIPVEPIDVHRRRAAR